MADDWDLYAVVRSCANSVATSTASSANITATATIDEQGDSFLKFSSPQIDDNQFQFPRLIDDKDVSFQGLEEIYKELHSEIYDTQQHSPKTKPFIPAPGELQKPLPQQPPHQNIPPQQVIQGQQNSQLRNAVIGSSISFPSTSPQPIRPRRRKNHQTKMMIHQMTQEELSADSWAWRKYGQKPIKGSPYPRNYYRCSTSKGCSARKQVERCPTDPDIFVVSYSGEHTHPRPIHRSSLAGSTRSKFAPTAKSNSSDPINAAGPTAPLASRSSSPPAPASSFSPTARESGEEEDNSDSVLPNIENDNEYMLHDIEEREEEDGNDDEDILIPNNFMADDIFQGFQDLSGGTSDSSGAPPWTPTTSNTNKNKFSGEGGC